MSSPPLDPPVPVASAPEDRAVIVLHGLCSSSLEVRLFSRSLRDRGYRVVIPLIPGYSVAEQDAGLPYERWIEAVDAETRRLGSTCSHVHLCGISLGATLALAVAAAARDRVHSLSLISTTLFYDGWNVSRWRFLLPLARSAAGTRTARRRPTASRTRACAGGSRTSLRTASCRRPAPHASPPRACARPTG
jgi:carboxylesterase